MFLSDTILAIASPPGCSPRGIIRLSGVDTFAMLERCCVGTQGLLMRTRSARRSVFSLRGEDGVERMLPILLLTFPPPHSYTGEASAELQLPGNPRLLQRVVEQILATAHDAGVAARMAEPGEFTARAFFNDRISLTQAEGIAATIGAVSDAQLHAAAMLRSGALATIATSLADRLANALALVEAGIDFSDEEDVVAISPGALREALVQLRDEIAQQLERSVGSEQLQAIPWVVLVGRPNTGKSTLFNALLGRERAVTSEIAGTTRDVLAEPLHLMTVHGDAEVMLVDLAGLDDVDESPINRQMQQRAREAIDRAELLLHCVPVDAIVRLEDLRVETERLPIACSKPVLSVWTKSDDAQTNESNSIGLSLSALRSGVLVSARAGGGLEELRREIADRLADRTVSLAADAMALQPRHEAAMRAAMLSLNDAIATVETAVDARQVHEPELIAASMRTGLDELALLAGDISPDDVLGRIFSSFCIGK